MEKVHEMRIVPLRTGLFCALIVLSLSNARAETLTLPACDYTLTLSNYTAQQGADSIKAVTMRDQPWTLVAFCRANVKRTSDISEIQERAREAGDFIRSWKEFDFADGQRAAVFRNTTHNNPVVRIEGYFATRDFEYRFILVPDKGRFLKPQEWDTMQSELEEIIRTSHPGNQTPAPTEAAFRFRLAAAVIIFAAVLALTAAWLLKTFLKRRKK